jgi:single-strand DNA-binding protein
MVSLNKVLIIGNLTKDPELRYTPTGTAVATLRMAINSMFKGKDGQQQKDTCFINVIAWGQIAEVCNQYLSKGKPAMIEGRLQSRTWTGNDGQKRSVIEVKADRVQFLSTQGRADTKDVDLGQPPQEQEPNMEVEDSADNN